MRKRQPWLTVRRGLTDIDREHELDADAEYALAEHDYQRWLNRQWDKAEGYENDDDPNAFDPEDPFDTTYLVPPWVRGRL